MMLVGTRISDANKALDALSKLRESVQAESSKGKRKRRFPLREEISIFI